MELYHVAEHGPQLGRFQALADGVGADYPQISNKKPLPHQPSPYANALKLIPYYYLGQLGQDNVKLAVILMVPAALAVWLGVWLVRWLPEKRFFQLVTWTLLLLSVKLISDGIQGLVA